MRAKGLITVARVTLADGKDMPLRKACDYGWITPERAPAGWNIGPDEVCIGENLFVDNGRQLIAYCMGFRAPMENYTIQKFGVGTGIAPSNVTNVSLEAPVVLASGLGATTAPITGIDFITAFTLRVGFTLGVGDANGYLLTEFGLFSGNNTLIARKVRTVGINKQSDAAIAMHWRLRF